ncbi:MAG: hypothetical protein V1925_02215 [Candidatus Omnitrophota bacterium]
MQKRLVGILAVLLLAFPLVCFGQEAAPKDEGQPVEAVIGQEGPSECEKAGGQLTKTQECDGLESDWCVISERQQCYADQVQDGKCTVGEYSEELQAIIGITPRVICDSKDNQ